MSVSSEFTVEVRTMHGAAMAHQRLSFRGRSRRIWSLNRYRCLRSSGGFSPCGTLNGVGSVEHKLIG
jgi:hypothetical protein